jgi:hypothetical protein
MHQRPSARCGASVSRDLSGFNSPQAWSATTVYTLLQCLLGLKPFAPFKMLFVDPHLPAWLPEITIAGLRVADATVTIPFSRKTDSIGALDADRRCVALSDARHLEFDLLSLDVGSEIDTSWLETLGDRLLPLRPLGDFMERWPGILAAARGRPGFRVAVVGAGAAGTDRASGAARVRSRAHRRRLSGGATGEVPRRPWPGREKPG